MRPAAVVISASPMPAVAASGFASAPFSAPNVCMMPMTVPRMPSIGSAVMIVETTVSPFALTRPARNSNAFQIRIASPRMESPRIGHMTGPPFRKTSTSFAMIYVGSDSSDTVVTQLKLRRTTAIRKVRPCFIVNHFSDTAPAREARTTCRGRDQTPRSGCSRWPSCHPPSEEQ